MTNDNINTTGTGQPISGVNQPITDMGQQFVDGAPVYDAAGEKVGTVSDQSVPGSYLVVQKGWLFHKDIYVPLNLVQRNDADGIYLTVYKDDLSDQQYENPPIQGTMATGMGTTAAYGYTDTAATAGYTDTTTTVNAANTVTTDQDIRVPVMEEELAVGKRQEEVGRVHLHKDVIQEQQTVTEPVMREEVHVERVPVQGEYTTPGPDAFVEKDIDVPVVGEELVVGKRAVVTEEVRLHKDAVTEQQQVSDTVRKERVVVDGVDETQGVGVQGVQGTNTQATYQTTDTTNTTTTQS